MAQKTRITILFCGQGMSTLVEVYNSGDHTQAPDHLVLIDFGGDRSYSEFAVEYVIKLLLRQKKPKFDFFIISHQDGDHLSLLPPLVKAFEYHDIKLTVSGTYLGGNEWSSENRKIVMDFLAYAGLTSATYNAPNQSHYNDIQSISKLDKLIEFGDTKIRVLISGLTVANGGTDIIRNASSAVIVVENGFRAVVLPGDATYETMAAINKMSNVWNYSLIPPTAGLEVPHHGSLRTAVTGYNSKLASSQLGFEIVKKFSENFKPKLALASAGFLNHHHHPVQEVLNVFEGETFKLPKEHTYVSYVFDNTSGPYNQGWEQIDTNRGTFTTVNQIKNISHNAKNVATSKSHGQFVWGHLVVDLPTASGMEAEVEFVPVGHLVSPAQTESAPRTSRRPPFTAPAP